MKLGSTTRHFAIAFLLALVGYAVFYQAIEHRRVSKGPWQVTFTNTAVGDPAIVIAQSSLAINNVQIAFPGATPAPTNNATTILFTDPRPVPYDVPFGKCVFMDLTFLPGTITFHFYGHQIELLPRALMIDRQDHPWLADQVISLHPAEQPTEVTSP